MVSKKGARIQARCIIILTAWIDARFLTAQIEKFRFLSQLLNHVHLSFSKTPEHKRMNTESVNGEINNVVFSLCGMETT